MVRVGYAFSLLSIVCSLTTIILSITTRWLVLMLPSQRAKLSQLSRHNLLSYATLTYAWALSPSSKVR